MYQLQSIQLYVRETGPARFASALGKKGRAGAAPQRVTSPLCHVRVQVRGSDGKVVFGCAADRLSVRWLDKRPGRSKSRKLHELVGLIEFARSAYLAKPRFATPFALWADRHPLIMKEGARLKQETLTSSFASALFERALVDAVCRLHGLPFWKGILDERIGFSPKRLHSELPSRPTYLARPPRTRLNIRHTVGLFDPLTDEDWPADKRLNDGQPETLLDCIKKQGIRFFKVKISGDIDRDLKRLARIWEILPLQHEPVVTLDANEAFEDLEVFDRFVRRLEREQLGLFQHVLLIEQPLRRDIATSPQAAQWIPKISKRRPVIIDESDGELNSFRKAQASGYAGTSHKNCKGLFKSLANLGLVEHFASLNQQTIMSGEDLQNLPVVPLQQDFVTVAVLGLDHCERNGHHYNLGLSMLSAQDKEKVTSRHPDLYEKRGAEWFMKIRQGAVQIRSLHGVGFGVIDEPDWSSMKPLREWLTQRYPAR